MSLSDYKLTDADVSRDGVAAAPDKLTGTAAQNKSLFDRLIRETVKVLYNGLIDELAGNNGAEDIGVDAIEGLSAQTVQHALSELAAKLFSLDAADVGVEAQLPVIQPENVSDALAQICDELGSYQPTLTFDTTPTANSTNPVTSGGIKSAIDAVTVVLDSAAGASAEYTRAKNALAAGKFVQATVAITRTGSMETLLLPLVSRVASTSTRPNDPKFDYLTFGGISANGLSLSIRLSYEKDVGESAVYAWSACAADALLEKTGGTMTGVLNMNSKKITSLASPTENKDAATKKYVDDAIAAAIASLGR